MSVSPDTDADDELAGLAHALTLALRRDAAALEAEGSPDLRALADQLDALLARLGSGRDEAVRRTLLQVLDEVQRFHTRLRRAHTATGDALAGADQRRQARRAYGEAQRYARGPRR